MIRSENLSWWRHEKDGFVIPQIAMNQPVELQAGTSRNEIKTVFESPEDRVNIVAYVVPAEKGKWVYDFSVTILQLVPHGEGTPVLGHHCRDNERERIYPGIGFKGLAGRFRIDAFSPGTATLSIEAAGYATTKTALGVPTWGHHSGRD